MYTNWNGEPLPIKSVKYYEPTYTAETYDENISDWVTWVAHELVENLSKSCYVLAVRC